MTERGKAKRPIDASEYKTTVLPLADREAMIRSIRPEATDKELEGIRNRISLNTRVEPRLDFTEMDHPSLPYEEQVNPDFPDYIK